jgi:putative transposase
MSQSLSKVYVHIIFSTKLRKPFITKDIQNELYSYIVGTLINLKSDILKINGTKDHIHILCTLPRTITIA